MPMSDEMPDVVEPKADTGELSVDTEQMSVSEPEAPKVKAKPKVKATPKPEPVKSVSSEVPHGAVVSMSALDVDSNAMNSASVRWVQTRLIELGHMSAGSDLRGNLGDGTVEALAEYAAKAKIDPCCEVDPEVVKSLMKGTPAKVVA